MSDGSIVTKEAQSEDFADAFQILDRITDGFISVDRRWRYTFINRAGAAMANLSPEDFIGKTLWEMNPGALGTKFQIEYERALVENISVTFTEYLEWVDLWLEVNAYPSETGLSIFFRNVTEQIRRDEKLRQTTERYRALFDSIDEGFCVCQMIYNETGEPVDYRFLEVNLTFELQSGIEQGIGKTILEVAPDFEKHWFEIYGQIVRTGKPERFENHSAALNKWFNVFAFRVGEPEEKKFAVLFTDITEKKRMDMSAALLAEVSQDLVRLTGIDEMMQAVGEKIGAYLQASLCAFIEINEAADQAVVGYNWHREDVPGLLGVYSIRDFVPEEFKTAAHAGEVFVVRDVVTDSRFEAEKYKALKIGSFVYVPLLRDNQWRFVIAVCHQTAYDWQADEIELVRELTQRVWISLERRRAEESARENQVRLRFALESANIGDWDLDLNTGKATRSFLHDKCFGATAPFTDWSYERFLTFVHPNDLAEVERKFGTAIKEQKEWHFECRIVWHDRSIHWIEAHGSVYRTKDGKPARMLGIISDISERKKIEQERERFFALTSDLQVITKTDGYFKWVSPTFERLLGWTQEEMISQPWVNFMHPDDARDSISETENLFSGQETFAFENRYRHKDGSFRRFLWNAKPFPEENVVYGAAIDITEIKEAEEIIAAGAKRLETALQAGKMGSWELNLTNGEMISSVTCKRNYGRQRDDVFTYEDLVDSILPEDRERWRQIIGQAIDRCSDFEIEYQVRWLDNSIHWIQVSGNCFTGQTEKAESVAGVTIDITSRKQTEIERERLLASEREARLSADNANRLKDEFLATVSHELRTPLNAILGWSQMLRNNNIESTQAEKALMTIERNAKAQSQLIDDILDVSRIITGKLRLNVRAVDLSAVIIAAVDTARPAAEAKNIRLQTLLDPDAGPISGDPDRLQQVVWNLLSNAVKFTDKGGRVQARLERINSHVEIVISDTGKGIESDFLPHVFERFRQSDGSKTRRHGGLGLGLAIVRELVELHGGTVSVASTGENQGASFTVSLPLLPVRRDPASDEQRIHPGAQTETALDCPPELDGLNVLIVDDEPDSRDLLCLMLDRCGAQTISAASAAEAFELIRSKKFDVVISDIGMPEEDGFSLIRKIRSLSVESGGKVPAIALTAYARAEDRIQALRAGFQMHISKPVENTELIAAVANLSGRIE